MTILVTTPFNPARTTVDAAVGIARELDCSFVPRGHKSVAGLLRAEGREAALVVGPGGIRLMTDAGSFGFHPNMAGLRILALRQGRSDRMVTAMGLQGGWRVLDCTCGLGADAIVAAHIAGPTGEVCAVEHSRGSGGAGPLWHAGLRAPGGWGAVGARRDAPGARHGWGQPRRLAGPGGRCVGRRLLRPDVRIDNCLGQGTGHRSPIGHA